MSISKGALGAILGAAIAVMWVVFDGGAVLLIAGLAFAGFALGSILDDPSRIITLLQRLQED